MLSLISAVVDPNTATIRLADGWQDQLSGHRSIGPKYSMMIAVRECGGPVDYLLTRYKTARQRGYELCLFSKNCGIGSAWLAYSINCQA
jgi:hypothetical protein